jgi:hypothetical protein
VIEGCSKYSLAQEAAVVGPQEPPELARYNLRHGVSILQMEGGSGSATARLCRDDRKLYRMGVADWISSRIGLITG